MKGKFEFLMVIAVLCLPGMMSGEAGRFFSRVEYAVSLPMAEEDVVYNIDLASEKNPADTLLGQRYLIRWEYPARENVNGFTSYFDGHFYSFRDNKLREYHFQWDSIPFQTSEGGIQRNAIFLNLFPFEIDRELAHMRSDSTYTLTESETDSGREIHCIRTLNGLEAMVFDLEFDSEGKPLKIDRLFNPELPGEQEIRATYSYEAPTAAETFDVACSASTSDTAGVPSCEEELIALFPEEFARFRTANYTIENLRGAPLPAFALQTVTRERYLYNKGDRFATPKILALLDPAVASTSATIAAMREATFMLPRQAGLIFAFVDNDVDKIEELVGGSKIGEQTLISARSLSRDTGANAFPTILLINTDGTVSDVILGYEAGLRDRLVQQGALLK